MNKEEDHRKEEVEELNFKERKRRQDYSALSIEVNEESSVREVPHVADAGRLDDSFDRTQTDEEALESER
jgi:hypothetical protein